MATCWAAAVAGPSRSCITNAFATRSRPSCEADTLSLGVCNGCQMFAHLKSIIPGAAHWPRFVRNRSEQFEARASLVRINAVDSPWLDAHGGLGAADRGCAR